MREKEVITLIVPYWIPLVHLTHTNNDLEEGLRKAHGITILSTSIRWVEGSPMSKKVLEAKVLKEYLSAKMNLDSYNGLTDPQEHIQNIRGSLELVT